MPFAAASAEHRRDHLLRGRDLRITDLKREKNSVQTSNSPASNSRMTFSAIASALAKPIVRTRAQLDHLDDLLLELPPQLVVALAADAEELDRLALGGERGWRARAPAARSRS